MNGALESARALIEGARDAPRFEDREVPPELLAEVIDAAAPRCPPRFAEAPWRFVVVLGPEREQLVAHVAEALARHWGLGPLGPRGLASDSVLNAPALVLVFSALPSSEGLEAIGLAAGATQNLILLARAAGLATHRIYSPHVVPEAVLDFVGERLGPELRASELVTMLAVGFPGAGPPDDDRPCATAIRWIGRGDLSPPAPPPGSAEPLRPAGVLRALRGERVLVADAYPYNREQIASQLAAGGYAVEAFADGQALLQAVAARGQPALYVISESMPDTSGFELVRRILGAGGLHAPIVITTARRDSAFRIAGLTAGVDYYLRKPVNPIELYTAARILLERHHLVEELQRANLELGRALSELRQAQARLVQQAKMASLGQLVAGVAHEINTPLGAVVSNNDLFLRCFARLRAALDGAAGRSGDAAKVAEAQVRRDLAAIESLSQVTRDACARITGIVRTLRTFARVDVAELRPVDLHEGIDSTLALIAHLTKPGTVIERRYGALPPVECHPNQINQVFMNLLVNACQAIDEAGTITIATARDGERVRIAIADTGRGIAPELRARLFDPGFTTKDAGHGTGLGLMICEQIALAHGGQIVVESELGKGSSFTVVLPVRQAGRDSPGWSG